MDVIKSLEIGLARPTDAATIAMMSRDLIEQGLGWRWTPMRILRSIRERSVNVAVARDHGRLAGFGIMQYRDDEAHLMLLAVDPGYRRKGVGSALMRWLEDTILTAGIGVIYLEARARNSEARAFYRRLGYREIKPVRNLYAHGEDGVRIAKDLWEAPIVDGAS